MKENTFKLKKPINSRVQTDWQKQIITTHITIKFQSSKDKDKRLKITKREGKSHLKSTNTQE